MAIKANVNVDGVMVLTFLALGAAAILWMKRETVKNAVNPLSDQNLAYKGANALVGENNFATFTDYVFGAFNILSDSPEGRYARQVYGISDSPYM